MHEHDHTHISPPLGRREIWIVTLVSMCLLWTTWTIGGVKLWAQFGSNVIAFAALAAAVIPSERHGYSNLRSLLRFIPFWLGLFVVGFILAQVLNASWMLETGADGKTKAVPLEHIQWLPSGISAAWSAMSPKRMLLIFMPCWLVTCALWCGSKRPRAIRILMWAFSINGAAFAIIGVLQSMTKTPKVLWLFDRPVANKWFWGMMANQNHAAAFMNLALAASLALFIYYTGRHAKEIARGGVYLMLIPLSVIIIIGVLQAMSRAGIVVAVLIVVAFLFVLAKRLYKFLKSGGNRKLMLASVCIMAVVVGSVCFGMRQAVNMEKLTREVRSMFAVADSPESDSRFVIGEASLDLFQKRPLYGWGAGCYRYFISSTQKDYPKLMTRKNKPIRIVYAHNEYLNALCDLGIVGALPLFAGVLGLPAYIFLYKRKGIDGALWVGLAGIGTAMLHMSLEFFMQHPLAALQFAILLAAVTRMACLSHDRSELRGRQNGKESRAGLVTKPKVGLSSEG
jgi:hypothetical protein